MKKLVALTIVGLAALALASSAEARGAAPTEVSTYRGQEFSATRGIVWGQVFSDKASCVSGRKYKLVAFADIGTTRRAKPTVVDTGRASKEGSIAGVVKLSEVGPGTTLALITPKTSKCGGAGDPLDPVVARAKPAKSDVQIVGVDGSGKDGAFAGVVTADSGKCLANRKVKMISGGKTLDTGTTSKRGAWALHLTAHESDSIITLKVSVKATSKCAGGSDVFAEG